MIELRCLYGGCLLSYPNYKFTCCPKLNDQFCPMYQCVSGYSMAIRALRPETVRAQFILT